MTRKIIRLPSLLSLPYYRNQKTKFSNAAWAEALRLTGRPEAPASVYVNETDPEPTPVPEDLADQDGHMQLTSTGHLVSGSMLYGDTVHGDESPGNVLWFAVGPTLVLPVVGLQALASAVGGWTGQACTAALMGIAGGYTYATYKILGAFWGTVAMVSGGAAVLAAAGVGGALGPIMPYAAPLAVAAPFWYTWAKNRARGHALQENFAQYMFGLTGKFAGTALPMRVDQAIMALKDTSPKIVIGHATGRLAKKWVGLAPDSGKEMILTCFALFKHFLVTGKSGTGKTSRFLRPILLSWIKSGFGGGLTMDGKGQLALEFKQLLPESFDLMEPGVLDVSLVQGLNPEQFTLTIYDLNAASKGDNKVWDENSFKWIFAASTLLWAAIQTEQEENDQIAQEIAENKAAGLEEDGIPPEPQWTWSYSNIVWFAANLATAKPDENGNLAPGVMSDIINWIRRSRLGGDRIIQDVISFATVEVPQMGDRVQGSVLFTALSWLTPVMTNEGARQWANLDKGYDVEQLLKGRMGGINVPVAKYGKAGRIINALIKKRFVSGIERRPFDWASNGSGHKPALLMMDECQAIFTPNADEVRLAPMARSQGMALVCGTQSVDSLYAAMGDKQAAPLLDVFSSWAMLRSSSASYEWASKELGLTQVMAGGIKTAAMHPITYATKLAASPGNDPNHPMRQTLRSIAFHSSGRLGVLGRLSKSLFSFFAGNNSQYRQSLETMLETNASWRDEAVASPAEFSTYLNKRGMAFIKIDRGETARMDFCHTVEPIFAPTSKPKDKMADGDEYTTPVGNEDVLEVQALVQREALDLTALLEMGVDDPQVAAPLMETIKQGVLENDPRRKDGEPVAVFDPFAKTSKKPEVETV